MISSINIWVVFGFLFVHWVADFVAQTDWMALNKAKQWRPLLIHTGTYSAMMGVFIVALLPRSTCFMVIPFIFITFIAHTVTDYYTSRLNARLWKAERRHDFFVSIGFDQLLHIVQLLLTYQLIS